MRTVPTLFGCPLWKGKIKKRVAKKYLNQWSIGYIVRHKLRQFSTLKVGDLINDCSGFNGDIEEIIPFYRQVGQGSVLVDIDFQTINGGCSLISCGIQEELPREKIEERHMAFLTEWFEGGQAAHWYGGEDSSDYQLRLTDKNKKIEILQLGGHITDERGRRLPDIDRGL